MKTKLLFLTLLALVPTINCAKRTGTDTEPAKIKESVVLFSSIAIIAATGYIIYRLVKSKHKEPINEQTCHDLFSREYLGDSRENACAELLGNLYIEGKTHKQPTYDQVRRYVARRCRQYTLGKQPNHGPCNAFYAAHKAAQEQANQPDIQQ